MNSTHTSRLSSVDDYLGDAAGRFFGAGYRRVRYDYQKVAVEPTADGSTTLHTRLDVVYPTDWSRKKAGIDLRPHLSTVDALIVAVQAAELLLTHTLDLTPHQRRAMRVRQVRIKAAGAPLEDLADLPIRASVLGTEDDGRRSRVETTIGAMRVRCEIEHPAAPARPAAGAVHFAGPDELLGPAATRYYGTGFVHRQQTVRDIEVDPVGSRAEGTVHCADPAGTPVADHGIEGDHQPFLGLTEAFVTTLQLGQILLYELDGLRRGQSNTLWMRSTVLTAPGAAEPLPADLPIGVRLEERTLLERADGVWRTADIVGEVGGTTVRCSVTHRLP
ncbi:AvrD family protein [Kitasatospora sp. LaBMicrA B282]|uniref:AvrD family protein n=1 Tax=Kitasatospora sp. LaBMicrA B282 TaxID=3420949 RepID=UPI003D13018D